MASADIYAGAVAAGAIAGMRSMTAPAVAAKLAGPELNGEFGFALLDHPATSRVTCALAIGELLADKLPFMPKRTEVPSLAARAVSGGLSGAVVSLSRRSKPLIGAVLGAVAAIGATFAAYELRKRTVKTLRVPDVAVALAEDVVVAAASSQLLNRLGSR